MLQRGATPHGASASKRPAPSYSAHDGEDLLSGVLGGKRGGGKPRQGQTAAAAAGGASAAAAAAAAAEQEGDDVLGDMGKKRKAQRRTFKEANVLDMRGLYKLYQEMQKLPLSRKPGSEVRTEGCARLLRLHLRPFS